MELDTLYVQKKSICSHWKMHLVHFELFQLFNHEIWKSSRIAIYLIETCVLNSEYSWLYSALVIIIHSAELAEF